MLALDGTSLSAAEREAVEQFVAEVIEGIGDDILAIWLYGSRARGEERRPESDVDLMVIARPGAEVGQQVTQIGSDAWFPHAGAGVILSTQTWDAEWLANRRAIRSFFAQELDRDKVVLYGESL